MTGTKNNPQLTEEVEKLEELVQDLKERVHYLERELEMSVDEERFRRKVSRVIVGSEYEIEQNGMGHKVEFTAHPERLPNIANRVNELEDCGWRVADASDEEVTVVVEEGLINR